MVPTVRLRHSKPLQIAGALATLLAVAFLSSTVCAQVAQVTVGSGPWVAKVRDQRRLRIKPKSTRLLLVELSNIGRLFQATPKKDKDRPRLILRLAEGYAEAAVAFGKKADLRRAKSFRDNAIKFYKKLTAQYPKWCQAPRNPAGKRGCIDRVLYYLGYEYELHGDLSKARHTFLELVQNWKKSSFVPLTYFAFGELFLDEARSDPSKWPVAGNFYQEVLKYPAPNNPAWGSAAYALGVVQLNSNKRLEAKASFLRVVRHAKKFPQLPHVSALRQAASHELSKL